MPIRFEAVDPRGLHVVCTTEQWQSHIIAGHPEVAGCEMEVQNTISNPLYGFVFSDRDHENRAIYYSRRAHRQREYMKVVVEVHPERGIVITAYPTNNMKAGEYLIWPSSPHS